MSAKDIAKFGIGYQTDSELHGTFVLSDEHVRFDKSGAGGAVQVQGYSGAWPLFDKPSERLGGADVIEVHGGGGGGAAATSKATQSDGASSSSSSTSYARRPKWMCRPKTTCAPCTKAEHHRPYCQPYGNRVLIECRRIEVTKTPERKPLPVGAKSSGSKSAPPPHVPAKGKMGANGRPVQHLADRTEPRSLQLGDVFLEEREGVQSEEMHLWARQELFVSGHVYKGYQICGRDRSKEAFDYAEFVAVNLILALAGIFFLLQRQRVLAGQHQSMLARRIGRT